MAKKIYNDKDVYSYMKSDEEGQWFKIKFKKDGLANFYINSSELKSDIDLYVYEDDDTEADCLAKSTETLKSGIDDIIRELKVIKNKYYYIYVKNYDDKDCSFKLRAKIYPREDKEFDLGIKSVDVESDELENLGQNIELEVKVKNYHDFYSPEYKIVLEDRNENELCSIDCEELEPDSFEIITLKTKLTEEMIKYDEVKLKLKIVVDDYCEDEDEDDNEEVLRLDVNLDIVKRGDRNKRVKGIQEMLLALGLLDEPSDVDGIFGRKTEEAVEKFQRDRGLTVNGVVNNATRGLMADAVRSAAKGLQYAIPKFGLFNGLKLKPYMKADKSYIVLDSPILKVEARFSMFPTLGNSALSIDFDGTGASGTLYKGIGSADAKLVSKGQIKTSLDAIGVKIGEINGGDMRIKVLTEFSDGITIRLEYCKTISGHNIYQILDMTFRKLENAEEEVYVEDFEKTLEKEYSNTEIQNILICSAVILLVGSMVLLGPGACGTAFIGVVTLL